MSPILGIYASQISGHLSTNNFSSIATVTVGSGGASSITFSSIPSTYTHLQLRVLSRTTQSGPVDNSLINFNGDTGNNYAFHYLYGTGSSVGAGNGLSQSAGFPIRAIASTGTANAFGPTILDILDYANTNKYKTMRSLSAHDDNTSNGEIFYISNLWQSTSAITSISITCGGNWTQYSSFALYGIR